MRIESVQPYEVRGPWRADRVWRLVVLSPFVEAVILPLLATSYFHPLGTRPPDILGIPFGLVVNGILLGWAALGARVVWTTGSPVMASLAFVTTTIPAMLLLPMSPALILIMQNLTV